MANRPSLIKRKKATTKKTRSEQYMINHKAYGDEPVYKSKELTPLQLTASYNWYNYMCDAKEGKEYLSTYLKNTNRLTTLKQVKSIPDKLLPATLCWQARMMSQGAILPPNSLQFFENTLQESILSGQRMASEGQREPEGKPIKAENKPSQQERLYAQYDHIACQVEEAIDKFLDTWAPGFSMFSFLQANEVSQQIAKNLHDKYNPQLLEIETAYTSDMEGYEGYSKDKLFKLYGFFIMIVEDIEQFQNNKKKVRKTRTAKPVSTEKKLKNFKYKEFDNVLKIQSEYPSKIIGAAELWTFNTKYNHLTVYRMEDASGLDVSRMSIIGFDSATSKTKKIKARKVDEVLRNLQAAGKISLRKFIDEAPGTFQTKLQERVNDSTLLLRVVAK